MRLSIDERSIDESVRHKLFWEVSGWIGGLWHVLDNGLSHFMLSSFGSQCRLFLKYGCDVTEVKQQTEKGNASWDLCKGAVIILQMRSAQLYSDPNALLFQSRKWKNMVSLHLCSVWLLKTIRTHLSMLAHGSVIYWMPSNSSITYTFCQATNQNKEQIGSVVFHVLLGLLNKKKKKKDFLWG